MKKICIFGASGNAREICNLAIQCGREVAAFIDVKEGDAIYGIPVTKSNFFDPRIYEAVVAVGKPSLRRSIVEYEIPPDTEFASLVHPSVIIGKDVKLGRGLTINAYTVLACDIVIGDFCQLDFFTRVAHGSVLENYVTTTTGVVINGDNEIGDMVFFGCNSSTKEKISIISDTIVGAGAFVSKSIDIPGIYVGVPARKL